MLGANDDDRLIADFEVYVVSHPLNFVDPTRVQPCPREEPFQLKLQKLRIDVAALRNKRRTKSPSLRDVRRGV
jgi:hypothetical protein